MSWFLIFQIISALKDDIEKAAADNQITLRELINMVADVLDKTGLADTVVISPETINDIKKKLHIS